MQQYRHYTLRVSMITCTKASQSFELQFETQVKLVDILYYVEQLSLSKMERVGIKIKINIKQILSNV
jgi:hypothetical protein